MKCSITERPFGTFEDKPVTEYRITNSNGMQVAVINYGGTVTKIITADRQGRMANVIIGFDSMDEYTGNGNQYFGCIVGRYCNRIAHAKFSLDGKEYVLANNNNGNSLHGGIKGFDKAWWNIEKLPGDCKLRLSYLSKDGEEGFPGNLLTEVDYTLTENNELKIEYRATTDKATPVNFTSHCYFNLSGGQLKNILDHELKINADRYTRLDDDAIPTGDYVSVKNDRLDFTYFKKIGKDISDFPGGYDINFILNEPGGKAAELYEPVTGRFMEMFTTEPGLQFYSGNFLERSILNDTKVEQLINHAALCLEAQHFPDSPNKPHFPNCILRPGDTYSQTTVYKFSVHD